MCSAEMEVAGYALYDIIPHVEFRGRRIISIEGAQTGVYCVYAKRLDVTLLYCKTNLDLKSAYPPVLLRAARWQYGPDLMPYGLVTTNEILMNAFFINSNSRRQKPAVQAISFVKNVLCQNIEIPPTKVSARHLRYVTTRELGAVSLTRLTELAGFTFNTLYSLYKAGDLHESFFVGLIMWAMSVPDDIRPWIAKSGIWLWEFSTVEQFAKTIKNKFTLRLKALQNLVPIDLTPAFEMEVLVNRGVGSVDWDAEESNRTRPKLAEFDKTAILTECVKLFKRAYSTGSRPKKMKWEKYWKNRYQWAPTGAFHSQYPEDLMFLAKDRLSRNKLDTLTKMPKRSLEYFLNRPPQIRAWASTKYEWTKMRAIYGVDATNFILTGFAMGDCERTLSNIFPIGDTATEENVRRTVKEVLRNGVPFCFDYEDFNSQHSTEAMKSVLEAYILVFEKNLSQEQQAALVWAIDSLDDVKIRDDKQRWYQTKGTLLSGWRLTTFINTVLNYVYIQLLDTQIKVSTHNGDDVLAAVTRFSDVQQLMLSANKHKVRFQPQKCFLGATAEFLRIDHSRPGAGQYLARSISTYVHGPTEAALPNNVLDLFKATTERWREIEERHGCVDNLRPIHQETVKYICKKWHVDEELYHKYLNTNVLCGGLSNDVGEENFLYDFKLEQVKTDKEINDEEVRATTQLNQAGLDQMFGNVNEDDLTDGENYPGAYEYALGLSRSLFSGTHFYQIYKSVLKTLELNRSNIRFRVKVLERNTNTIDYLNAVQKGTHKTRASTTRVMLAKACGIPLVSVYDEVYKIKDLLAAEKDLDKALMIYS